MDDIECVDGYDCVRDDPTDLASPLYCRLELELGEPCGMGTGRCASGHCGWSGVCIEPMCVSDSAG